MNKRSVVSKPGDNASKITRKLLSLFTLVIAFIFISGAAMAATIVLNGGATVKGKLIDKDEEKITIQDPYTKQLTQIKLVNILNITLDPDESKFLEDKKKKGSVAARESMVMKLEPEIGILPGIAYPFGKIGSVVNFGYGANLFSDVRIPLKYKNFNIRLGLSVGFIFHGTTRADISANLIMLPITIYGKIGYAFDMGLRLYLKLGGGITPMMAKSMLDMDPTAAFGIGLGYVPPKAPFIEIFIEAGMMMLFEQVRGDFITANVGVAFRFGTPKDEPKKTDVKPAGK